MMQQKVARSYLHISPENHRTMWRTLGIYSRLIEGYEVRRKQYNKKKNYTKKLDKMTTDLTSLQKCIIKVK